MVESLFLWLVTIDYRGTVQYSQAGSAKDSFQFNGSFRLSLTMSRL